MKSLLTLVLRGVNHPLSIAALIALTLFPWSVPWPSHSNAALAEPSGTFAKLSGAWKGSGSIKLAGGNVQRITCRAYYNVKNTGADLSLAIRCASPDNKIEVRAKLMDQNGQLSGEWEERTFNATGSVTGKARPGSVALEIVGSVGGTIVIKYGGERQTVAIATANEGLKGIAIDLRR